jgi:RNA polymerase sigma factor (sigma-70 family)
MSRMHYLADQTRRAIEGKPVRRRRLYGHGGFYLRHAHHAALLAKQGFRFGELRTYGSGAANGREITKSRIKMPESLNVIVEVAIQSQLGKDGKRRTMASRQMNRVIQCLRRAACARDGAAQADGQLLENYLARRDETALETLLARHGPMVWGVCRRVLPGYHDAEDAFQATFLVFIRKAASVTPKSMLANWLYGVARQTALNLRTSVLKRKGREQAMANVPEPTLTDKRVWSDVQPILDEELGRLPDHYRAVIVICDLQGKTRKEAARHLHCPEGTVAGRLARARVMLAKRLAKRGVVVTGAALATLLAQNAASASVPSSVMTATLGAASLFTAGNAAATGVISPKVVATTEGVLKAMMMSKLKSVVTVVLLLGFMGAGAIGLTSQLASGSGGQPPAIEFPAKPDQKKAPNPKEEVFTAWGKAVGGLQAGLGYYSGQKRAYSPGETVKLVVRVRNVSKQELKFQYLKEYFIETPPAVTDGKGKPVLLGRRDDDIAGGLVHVPVEVNLAPGKEIEISELKLDPRTETQSVHEGQWTVYGTGTFSVQYERLAHPNIDKILGKLATGKLELVVRFPDQTEEKVGFTAWGKAVGGLQAGLGFRPGEKRAYHHGETVRLVVRIRNLGKEEVTFQYVPAFFKERPPTVADNAVPLIGLALSGRRHPSTDVTLAPGKEVELYEWQAALRPASDSKNPNFEIIYGTGKFSIQYERVLANSSASAIKIDPALSKLATGKLELEVKDAKKEEKKAFTAWGKEVGGLQVGWGFRPGEHRAYHHGETATLVLRVRATAKLPFSGLHRYAFRFEGLPAITDADGKPIPIASIAAERLQEPAKLMTAGKEIDLYELKLELRPASESAKKINRTLYGAGKFQIQSEPVTGEYLGPVLIVQRQLSKLATGKLKLEVKPTENAPRKSLGQIDKKSPQKDEQGLELEAKNGEVKQPKKGPTFWGKAVGGVQAGLGHFIDPQRPYAIGETVTLAVRVRNVGNKAVKFSFFNVHFLANPPTVRDGEGRLIIIASQRSGGVPALRKQHWNRGGKFSFAK